MARKFYFVPHLLLLTLWTVGCSIVGDVHTDPFYESFYEKARLIMTDEEIKIYHVLADQESRDEFIEEFWKIRDPDPDTGENEAKVEFEKRVTFASIRFSWRAARSRPLTLTPTKSDRGWDTDIGRIYIILGPPDRVFFSDGRILLADDFEGDFGWRFMHGSEREAWVYDRYRLAIAFRGTSFAATSVSTISAPLDPSVEDSASEYASMSPIVPMSSSLDLLSVLEFAKLNYINPDLQGDVKRPLRFKADYDQGKIILRIPARGIDFKEEDGKLQARFKMKINVYKDSIKLETFLQEKNAEETEESVLKKGDLRFEIPYPLSQKGRYLFDILLEDLTSLTIRKYRNIAKASF
jgi:GWxTD domain-containing protein